MIPKLIDIAAGMFSDNSLQTKISTNVMSNQVEYAGAISELRKAESLTSLIDMIQTRDFVDVVSVELKRSDSKGSLKYQSPDGIVATIEIVPPDKSAHKAVEAAAALDKEFKLFQKAALLMDSLPEANKEQLRWYESVLHDLTANVARIGVIATEAVSQREKLLDAKLSELEARYAEKGNALAADYKARLDDVLKREADLLYMQPAARRRENAKNLETALLNQFTQGVSQKTEAKRLAVHVVCIAILVVAGAGVGLLLWAILRQATPNWHLYWFAGALLAMFATTTIFYIRFLYSWFSELSQVEFLIRKYIADATRAEYVVDLFRETNPSADAKLPVTLLKSMLRDLFVAPTATQGAKHPIEDILGLVPKIKEANVTKDAANLKFGR